MNPPHKEISRHVIVQVDPARWHLAQEHERQYQQHDHRLAHTAAFWFKQHFDDFRVLSSFAPENCLEVGCGKYTNTRVIIPCLAAQPKKMFFEDPLVLDYFYLKKRFLKVFRFPAKSPLKRFIDKGAEYSAAPLECLLWRDALMDLVICINVLDHVMDFSRCIAEIRRVVRSGGMIVLAQDLSNEQDFLNCPESWADIMHPIKIDDALLDSSLEDFSVVYKRILPREQGLNPKAHYGTYFFIGKKT
jgi:SAM-dependent methyltransferase